MAQSTALDKIRLDKLAAIGYPAIRLNLSLRPVRYLQNQHSGDYHGRLSGNAIEFNLRAHFTAALSAAVH